MHSTFEQKEIAIVPNQDLNDSQWEDIREFGEEIAWQDWDSGGPGAGAGRVSVIRFSGAYYIDTDEGLSEPLLDRAKAIELSGVMQVNPSTVAIWLDEKGIVFRRI